MAMAPMTTGDISVQALNLVGQTHLEKEFQSPVYCRWLGSAFAIEFLKKVIGFGWFFVFQHQRQHLTADLGEPSATRFADGFGFAQRFINISRCTIKV